MPPSTAMELRMAGHDNEWNHAHLLALAWTPAYAAATWTQGWSATAVLAGHLFATLAWFAAFERWRPHRPRWRATGADRRRDAAFLGMNALADGLAGLLLAALTLKLALAGPAARLPLWAAAPLAVLVAEFGAYWLHRAMHRGGWGWCVHMVHHRPAALNVTNNLTTHPFNVVLLKAVKLMPLALLGFAAEAVLLAALFMQLQSFATHANTRGRMGWLNYFVGTAELHRWHHSTHTGEALNFSTAVPLWDQLFGTFRYAPGREPVDVGVEAPAAYPDANDTWALTLYPLRRRGRSA
jgi:sterol desaturase/sphingolipid hydroxylase (fatty acid hydroxylase superfamily)